MTRTLAVLCVLAVGACSESNHKKQDLAACKLEAIKLYPHPDGDKDEALIGNFAETCMTAKGYDHDCPADLRGFDEWITQSMDRCYRKAKAD